MCVVGDSAYIFGISYLLPIENSGDPDSTIREPINDVS